MSDAVGSNRFARELLEGGWQTDGPGIFYPPPPANQVAPEPSGGTSLAATSQTDVDLDPDVQDAGKVLEGAAHRRMIRLWRR